MSSMSDRDAQISPTAPAIPERTPPVTTDQWRSVGEKVQSLLEAYGAHQEAKGAEQQE